MAGGITDTGEPYSAFVSLLLLLWFIKVQLLKTDCDETLLFPC